MNDINLQLVREFFELNLFRVMTQWRQDQLGAPRGGHSPQLFVENTNIVPEYELGLVLGPGDLAYVHCAVVEIRAWHSDRFYSSLLQANPVVTQFAEAEALVPPREFFGTDDFKSILVVSELPLSPEQRTQSIEGLEKTKVDHIIEFSTILRELVDKVSINGAFTGSHTLQLIQLLKRYRLVRNQQMEFVFPMEGPVPAGEPQVETAEVVDDDGAQD